MFGRFTFLLLDTVDGVQDVVVAECCVRPIAVQPSCCCPCLRVLQTPSAEWEYLYITDLFVYPEYRRRGYATALLVNIFYHMETKYRRSLTFRLWVPRYNTAALECVRRVFGPPYVVSKSASYFSSTPVQRGTPRFNSQ